MQFKVGKNLLLALLLLAGVSGARADVISVADANGAPQYAFFGPATSDSGNAALLLGEGSFLNGGSIMTAYLNVSGGGYFGLASRWNVMQFGSMDFGDFDVPLSLPAFGAGPQAIEAAAPALPPLPESGPDAPAAPPLPQLVPPAPPLPEPAAPAPGPELAGLAGPGADLPPAAPAAPAVDSPIAPMPMPDELAPLPAFAPLPADDRAAPAADIPEPASLGLFALGLAGLLGARGRRS